MTNTTKQEELVLEEIVPFCEFRPYGGHPRKCHWCGEPDYEDIHTLRPLVRSLINQKVLEAIAEIKSKSGWIDEDGIFTIDTSVSEPLTPYVPLSAIEHVERKYRDE